MPLLVWQAANRGHFSDTAVNAVSDLSFDIGQSSYNEIFVKPYKIGVSNYQNKAALEIYFDSSASAIYVQPFTNRTIDCGQYTKCRIINRGNKKVPIRFVDKKLFDSAPDLFDAYPIQAVTSNYDLLFHFDDSLDNNEGFSTIGVEVSPSCALDTTNKKFGSASLLCNGGGVIIGASDYIDLNKDFTIDAWVRPDFTTIANGSRLTIFGIGNDSAALPLNVAIYRVDATNYQIHLTVTSIHTSINYLISDIDKRFFHAALTKKGNTTRFFIDGVVKNTYTNTITSVNSSLVLALGGTAILPANYDELRMSRLICQWSSNFTPPSSPYI